MKDILDIFYNHIVKEAAIGSIDCFFKYKVCFQTSIPETNTFTESKCINKYLLIPTLEIKDKSTFDNLLVEYVNVALKFYDDRNFCEEVLNESFRTLENMISKEKDIMTHLWSNATPEDFQNPCAYIRRQIEFLNNDLETSIDLGQIELLKGNITLNISKEKINQEAPYKISMIIQGGEEEYHLPIIRVGASNDTIYINAIQQDKKIVQSKKISRILYKVNNNYKDDEYRELTPSFLLALYIVIEYFSSIGYQNFKIPTYYPIRWNSKRINLTKSLEKKDNKMEYYQKQDEELARIQENITNNFVYFIYRLENQLGNIEIDGVPFEQDSYVSFHALSKKKSTDNILFSEFEDVNYHKKN